MSIDLCEKYPDRLSVGSPLANAIRRSVRSHRLGVRIICFSATASFSAGIALLAVGVVTARRTATWAELPYAAIPMGFGVQQLIEGGLWLGLPAQAPMTHMLTIVYLLFSNVLWPFYVPMAIWMIEPRAERRKKIAWPMAAGAATSVFFLIAIITHPVSARILGLHIKYSLPHPYEAAAFTLYAVATCLAPLLSSYRMVRLLGVVIIGSMIAAYIIYAMWFASTWCFFAALTSGIVLLHFSYRRTLRSDRIFARAV